ncbi:MAG: 5-methyltetrahydrofolate-homocysteine methyltransferase [uncultured bacterium]|nr:MAG: 5-methyltetrahydrofolate-homocysteine methyltransferase [uncultured bacterium]
MDYLLNTDRAKKFLLDGSYGDRLLKIHPDLGPLPDLANTRYPHDVFNLHQGYLDAGSEILLTNTFGCNLTRLSQANALHLQNELLLGGIQIARQAAVNKAYIAACLGPQGFGKKDSIKQKTVLEKNLVHTLELIAHEKVDLIVFETQYHYEEILLNLNTAQKVLKNRVPVWLSLTVTHDGAPLFASEHPDWLKTFEDLGIHWLGFNCGFGPESILKAIQKTKDQTQIPLTAKPNLGLPENIQNLGIKKSQKEFIKYAQEIINLGITAIGACCQSSPDDILNLSQLLNHQKL